MKFASKAVSLTFLVGESLFNLHPGGIETVDYNNITEEIGQVRYQQLWLLKRQMLFVFFQLPASVNERGATGLLL